MSTQGDVEFCPSRANIWTQIQYADASNIQVAKHEEPKYFQPPPDSDDEKDEEFGEIDDEGRSMRCPSPCKMGIALIDMYSRRGCRRPE